MPGLSASLVWGSWLMPMEESGCVGLGRRAPAVACVAAGVCGSDFLEEGAGADDMCAEREDAGAEGRVGRVDEGVGGMRKGAHKLDDVVVCAVTAAVVGVEDGEAVVWGWGVGRTGAVEDYGPCRLGVAGEEEDRNGPRELDSAVSEIFLGFQAAKSR